MGARGGRPSARRIVELGGSERDGAWPDPATRGRRYVAVAGNIGSGKSSLVEFLCRRYEIVPLFEPSDDNPFLDDFYADMRSWSFASQVWFLAAKIRMHLELDGAAGNVVQDRTIWEDAEIFAENLRRGRLMSAREHATYRRLYDAVLERLRPPDLLVYLRCPVAAVRRRIASRGREMERGIADSYLRRLHRLYERWIANYDLSPVLIIPTGEIDYLTDLVDRHDVLRAFDRVLG